MLAHGEGAVRNYFIGAFLLDRDDPTKVLARTARPLIRPTSDEALWLCPQHRAAPWCMAAR